MSVSIEVESNGEDANMAVSVTVGITESNYDFGSNKYLPTTIEVSRSQDSNGVPYANVTIDSAVTIVPHDVASIDRLICQLTIARARLDAEQQVSQQVHNARIRAFLDGTDED